MINPYYQIQEDITPLFYAVNMGNVELMKVLVQYGADINLQDEVNLIN